MWGSDVSPKPSVVGPGKEFRDGIWVSRNPKRFSVVQIVAHFWQSASWCRLCAGPGGQSRALRGSLMEEHWRMRMFPWVPARRYDANEDGFLALWYHTNSLELEENQN